MLGREKFVQRYGMQHFGVGATLYDLPLNWRYLDMNMKKGIRRISFICGLLSGLSLLTVLLVQNWRGTSYQVPKEPTNDEIALARSYASQERNFIWYRMVELDTNHIWIIDRSELGERDQWGLLIKDQYRQSLYYDFDDFFVEYMKNHKGHIDRPSDLEKSFVNSVYLARTAGVDLEYARTHQDTLFRNEAAKYSFQHQSQFPWRIEDLLTATMASISAFFGLWFMPYAIVFVFKKLIKYIREGFV
jgi:hypothetical protein